MTLSEIWIYPVKSLGGIRLSQAQVEERGLQYDRRWMIVDESGVFLSQRDYPKMALLAVALQPEGLKITDKNNTESYTVVDFETNSESISVKVWDDEVEAELTDNQEADKWLSDFLDKKVRLVKMPDNGKRLADPRYALHGEHVSFADGFPFLLISEASLEDLNKRLSQPVTMQRFRPNLVIKGMLPFQEDAIKTIQIGDIQFSIVKPCARCIMITIDPQTIQKGAEPLKTLATYRKQNNKILFGQNLTARNHGRLMEGNHVLIIE